MYPNVTSSHSRCCELFPRSIWRVSDRQLRGRARGSGFGCKRDNQVLGLLVAAERDEESARFARRRRQALVGDLGGDRVPCTACGKVADLVTYPESDRRVSIVAHATEAFPFAAGLGIGVAPVVGSPLIELFPLPGGIHQETGVGGDPLQGSQDAVANFRHLSHGSVRRSQSISPRV